MDYVFAPVHEEARSAPARIVIDDDGDNDQRVNTAEAADCTDLHRFDY